MEVEEILDLEYIAKGFNRRPLIEALVQLVTGNDYNHAEFMLNLHRLGKRNFQMRIVDKEANDILKTLKKIQRKKLSLAA